MKKISFVLSIILVFTLFLTVGCSNQTSQTGTNTSTSINTLEKVNSAGKVRVGVLADYAPWGVRNAKGEIEGYDIAVANKLAEALGVEVEIIPLEAPARVAALASDKVDVVIACITPTNERAKTIDFTIPYASAGQVVMTWADNDEIKTIEDVKDKKIAIVRGGTPDLAATATFPDADIIRYDTIADAYTAFQTHKADVFVEEDTFVYFQIEQNPQFKVVGEPISSELISIGLKKNDQEWMNYLNNFLTNLRFSGENAELYKEYFGSYPAPLTLK